VAGDNASTNAAATINAVLTATTRRNIDMNAQLATPPTGGAQMGSGTHGEPGGGAVRLRPCRDGLVVSLCGAGAAQLTALERRGG
jgi:hypothetical protein